MINSFIIMSCCVCATFINIERKKLTLLCVLCFTLKTPPPLALPRPPQVYSFSSGPLRAQLHMHVLIGGGGRDSTRSVDVVTRA